jgi:glucans biosynthesis protein
MFWFGENTEGKPDDYRAEVHDSDGLLMHLGNDELVWRPLINPPVKDLIRHSVFGAKNPKLFGLLQRDRDYRHYHEVNNFYHQTPSMVVRPKGDWGEGQVRLIEIGTVNEYADNIVAFWNPTARPQPLEPFPIAYTLSAGAGTGVEDSLSPNRVVATRLGAAPENPRLREITLDFAGPALEKLTAEDPPEVVPFCSPGLGHFSKAMIIKNPLEPSWRVFLKFEPAADLKDPVNMRCTLKKGGAVLTETWDYLWNPR